MMDPRERVALKTAAAKIRWRIRNLRLAADELEAVALALDALIYPPPKPKPDLPCAESAHGGNFLTEGQKVGSAGPSDTDSVDGRQECSESLVEP